ncbi:penicillin acylase family protein [Edaphobacter sp. HDX4]|uniref:penicillin acylase family protein n=1 Tax=Edaphobacter sp. HDX4 TaxID=2794064 RepID=UPI002FE61DD1
MSLPQPQDEPILIKRRRRDDSAQPHSLSRYFTIGLSILLILGLTAFFAARSYVHYILTSSLPQIEGALAVPGLSAPVAVQRDAHGVPHIRAASMDDLVFAQGFVTAQDRLFQMDLLRRHAAGNLAEILGPSLLQHDRIQRFLQLRATADRAVSALPKEQLHFLEAYARGVNASIAIQQNHLPLEFRVLRYSPAPWTPRDSILIGLVMYQDLTNRFATSLSREAITARLPPQLVDDLYPVGSWRDHPPEQPVVDLTAPQELPDIPLDESQTKLRRPQLPGASPADILALSQALRTPACDGCVAGSNDWAVSGTRTATGKPLLSNDMHLSLSVPGTWYQTDLAAPAASGSFHVAGASLPGFPFVIVGHNDHIAWGFTNLGADVQDVFIEHLRGSGSSAEFESADGAWHSILHQTEIIHVRGKPDVELDVTSTLHSGEPTPIISPLLPSEKRSLALRWTIYDPSTLSAPFFHIASATDWPSFLAAFADFGGPSQNVVYADDQGHIGYHAVGAIPIRGNPLAHSSLTTPPPAPSPQPVPSTPDSGAAATAAPSTPPSSPLSPVPVDAVTGHYDWLGYVPFVQLPQSFDPPNGVLATANARISPDSYPYTLTLNWAAPYRNERIWKVLLSREHLTAADMLTLQTDVYSDLDHNIAQRLAYSIDHSTTKDKRLHQAADLLRNWNGQVDASSPAPPIVNAAREALWRLLLEPRLGSQLQTDVQGDSLPLWKLYTWGEKSYAAEQIIMHTPDRWLPPGYTNWNELLTAAVDRGLADAHAPSDLSRWQHGQAYPIDLEHPVFSRSAFLRALIHLPIGTGVKPLSGDTSTIKQVGRTFGPSERFTADLSDIDRSTFNLVLGESGNLASPWFMDQWPAWYNGTTFPMPFTTPAVNAATRHTLTLQPQ